jgi:hypothetical protein
VNKQRYYVSVQSGTVMLNKGDAAYELEIEALPVEKENLDMLLWMKASYDDSSFVRTPIPGVPYHFDEENDSYDAVVTNIYKLIYELGTEETKEHISSMNLLKLFN